MYCKVYNCRYPDSHTTLGHTCGKCYKLGHGQVECMNQALIEKLSAYNEELPHDEWCSIGKCGSKYHNKTAHRCDLCNQNGHENTACPNAVKIAMIFNCPICKVSTEMLLNQQPLLLKMNCGLCDKYHNTYSLLCGHSNYCYDCIVRLSKPYSVYPEDEIPDYLVESSHKIFGSQPGRLYTAGPGPMGSAWYIRRSDVHDNLYGFMIDQSMHGQYGISDYPKAAYFVTGHTYVKM